jgi:hypothetical protein
MSGMDKYLKLAAAAAIVIAGASAAPAQKAGRRGSMASRTSTVSGRS